MTIQPELLYHALQAPLYPTQDASLNLLAVRFTSPVRITTLRITPEGVAAPDGPGATYPSTWTGKVFLNVSPSTPVNAMLEMQIDVAHSQHPLDFRIDMPPGVTTRLVSLLTPASNLSVSIYGYGPDASGAGPSVLATADNAHHEQENWGWVSSWAGGISGLLELVGNPSTYAEVRGRAVLCLELLQSSTGDILPLLLDHPAALARVFEADGTLCRLLLESKEHIMHLNLKRYVSPDHPLSDLVHASAEEKRRVAWNSIEHGLPALSIIARTLGQGAAEILAVSKGYKSSNLSRLLAMAEDWADRDDEQSRKCLELALDIISSAPPDPVTSRQLASRLPRLILVSRVRGSSRGIGMSTSYADAISRALLLCLTEIIGGQAARPHVLELIGPYLDHLDHSGAVHRTYTNTAIAQVLSPFPDTCDGRALARLEAALSASTSSAPASSQLHVVTTADLLSIIAPTLLRTLASAPVPPLNIPSSIPDFTPDSQASAWAGKVYSEHEFRTRENVGLGIAGVSGQAARMSRPASRHVDEYAR